jgi:hypothetical protein
MELNQFTVDSKLWPTYIRYSYAGAN